MRGMALLYVQQFRTTLAMLFQYRASLLIWMIGHVMEPLVYLIAWSVVASGGGESVGDYAKRDFAAYFIVLMLVNHVTYTWFMHELEYRIRHGALSFELLRPVHPIHWDFADNVSTKIITMPFILGVAGLLALLFRPALSLELWAMALFVPALGLAFIVRFLLEWTLGRRPSGPPGSAPSTRPTSSCCCFSPARSRLSASCPVQSRWWPRCCPSAPWWASPWSCCWAA